MIKGDQFPPLVVFHDGESHWLASGFHRYAAAAAANYGEVEVDVRQGTRRDAVLFSAGVNAEHGLRRTNDDKRRAVRKLLEDDEWREQSDGWIAAAARVSDRFVATLREELFPAASPIGSRMRTVHRGGTTYQMDTRGSGRPTAEVMAPLSPTPHIALARPAIAGHREQEERSRFIAHAEAMRAVITAQRTLPADPRIVAANRPDVTIDEAFRISTWWAKLAAELRNNAERAS